MIREELNQFGDLILGYQEDTTVEELKERLRKLEEFYHKAIRHYLDVKYGRNKV